MQVVASMAFGVRGWSCGVGGGSGNGADGGPGGDGTGGLLEANQDTVRAGIAGPCP